MVMEDEHFTNDMVEQLQSVDVLKASQNDLPNYWAHAPASLVSKSNITSISFGTGHNIYRSRILRAILEAQSEAILVTCFWARSETLNNLNDTLRKLSAKALQAGRTIKVRICFSSSSLWQKLLHTSSLQGQTYAASKWSSTLGLPAPNELRGLDMEVKSIFVLPFSVMHPKFVIIDGARVFLPSCNVSWEEWFEGCIEFSGPIIEQFARFWQSFWASSGDKSIPSTHPVNAVKTHHTKDTNDHSLLASRSLDLNGIQSVFLPSPHHRNPRFTLPWQQHRPPPSTPLNICLLALFAKAEKSIFIQTPNLTSPPVLYFLIGALKRGINVRIMTSERLMLLEQLVTAGTTTNRCIERLIKQHKRLLHARRDARQGDLESGLVARKVGQLRVEYFQPRSKAANTAGEPVQSHLKLTIVDDRIAVYGSGNMDRASWYTSQELGVAFVSAELVAAMKEALEEAMKGRSKLVYDSDQG